MNSYHIIHWVVFVSLLISLSFICVCIARVNTGWFRINDTFAVQTSPPSSHLHIDCEIGTLYFECPADSHRASLSDIDPFFADGDLWARGGKVALAFCCASLPFLILGLAGALFRGAKLSGNKMLSSVTTLCSWIAAILLVFPWTVFAGMVIGHNKFEGHYLKDLTSDHPVKPYYCWALAIVAWFLTLLSGLLMIFAMKAKGDGPFGSGGTASFAR